MRRYDDPVEVRRGMVAGWEAPEQFLWRGRLWKVRDVVAHWVETEPWWRSAGLAEVLGHTPPSGSSGPSGAAGRSDGDEMPVAVATDLLGEREVWRVEAARGMAAMRSRDGQEWGHGVFDLVFDWADGAWTLVGCQD